MQASGHSVPPELAIEVSNEETPALTSSQRDYEIVASVARKPVAGAAAAGMPESPERTRPRPRARLVLLGGDSPVGEVEIDRDVFYIGRLKEVRDRNQRPARRNHLYFRESETSVSRQHAHIRYSPETGEFRIFDDHSARGTRLFSNGEPIDVPAGRSRGEPLHSGDEIYFGSVAARFEILNAGQTA